MSQMVIKKIQLLGHLILIVLIKKTPKFVDEIQSIINNDPNKSIRPISRDMGKSKFLIRQVVHEDIRYYS